jgi:hypothetical protein
MREIERIGNQLEQIQTAMSGILERLINLEGCLVALEQSKKPSVYIDENTALLSTDPADIKWIARK